MTSVVLGDADVAGRAADLARRLPDRLAPLARLALDVSVTWRPGAAELWSRIDADLWERCGEQPVHLLQEAGGAALERAAADDALVALMERVAGAGPAAAAEDLSPVAYLCAEFGVHHALPVYSGGLGALAGDVLKEAADNGPPMVGVGLLYRDGYFRQRVDLSGWQQEHWDRLDPHRTPAVQVTRDGAPLELTVPVGDDDVVLHVWRVDVGRVPLFLLDADLPVNAPHARFLTARLYVGDQDLRLGQYVLLGVGGMRALEAVGVEPRVVHLNEGHAAFAALELVRRARAERVSVDEAIARARARTVFTTHTPVPAGNDTFPAARVAHVIRRAAAQAGIGEDVVLRLGRTHPDDEHEPVGVTQLALRVSRDAIGVSRRHGEVAREMWAALWPDRDVGDVPIGHVTNGVHVPTWIGRPMRELLDRHLGAGWIASAADPATWSGVDAIPDEELLAARRAQREALVRQAAVRVPRERLGRGDTQRYAEAPALLDPDALTLGFARRVATYKRLHLLLSDIGRARGILRPAGGRPVQVLIAGKAHPRDDDAKSVLQRLFQARDDDWAQHVCFLEDYDLRLARSLVQGCDVWINLPRPPLEASGTSGMKAAMNGALNLSVLDGWWGEAYDGTNGWAIDGEPDPDHAAADARDAGELLRLLQDDVLPQFGTPAWADRVRASLRTIGPAFAATRMLDDYRTRLYDRA